LEDNIFRALKLKKLTLYIIPLVLISCEPEPAELVSFEKDQASIADFLEENRETYSGFYSIAVQGGIMIPLSAYNTRGDGFTLFLPTDEAFKRYIDRSEKYASFEELMADSSFVKKLGRYHIVNTRLHSTEFPYGALPASTATGDLLMIGFSTDLDSMVCRINNLAPVIEPNHVRVNGYIHIISEVLEPIDYSAYNWLRKNTEYSILADALEITGFNSRLGLNSKYTILAEHDSVFNRYGIYSIDDLKDLYKSSGIPYTEWNNALYQFAAYHVLKGRYYLSDFRWGSRNYNTYAYKRVKIIRGLDFAINPGNDTISLEISESGDTTVINYIRLLYEHSNIPAKRQVIHILSDVMYLP
jgi:uncharacterized surface protein with fasciclin (FAS1) repeats